MQRRHFLATLAAASAPLSLRAQDAAGPLPIKLSLKCGMAKFGATLEEKFRILKELGYDGVELDSPVARTRRKPSPPRRPPACRSTAWSIQFTGKPASPIPTPPSAKRLCKGF